MILHSFIASQFGLRPVKVEIVLVPGVSQIQILGLPDQSIKESSGRIISALRHQGFRMPPGKQALVNLYPQSLKKTSQGLDLVIALGILLESGQIKSEEVDLQDTYVYGALTLKGDVELPLDLSLLNYENFYKSVLTGSNDKGWRFQTKEIESLNRFSTLQIKNPCHNFFKFKKPELPTEIQFSQNLARLMMITALGEHSLLLAGNAGAGKTTLMENAVHLLAQPEEKDFLESVKYWKLSGRDLHWRPVVQPHHSITPQAMIGGGRPPKFGEISLAHGGALLLDELLEFHPQVQSALREPMEKGLVYIARSGSRQVFPAKALVLATTNLCSCGKFHPNEPFDCRCSSQKLRNYLERLSGPFLDRFAIFYLLKIENSETQVSLREMLDQLNKAREFVARMKRPAVLNRHLGLPDLMKFQDKKISENQLPKSTSHRRRLSLYRVARSIADLEESPNIQQKHLEEAQAWTSRDMHRLQNFRFQDFATR